MKKWFVLVLFVLSVQLQAQVKPDVYKRLWQLAKNFPNQSEVAVGIIDHGKKFYVGFKKENDTLIMVRNEKSVFGIASLTKLFTCALIANQVRAKKINLHDDIQRFYPFKIDYSGDASTVTIKSLCTHTSGLPADGGGNLEAYLKARVNISHEGGKYRYSNLGFMILGDVLERVSGKNYRDLLEQKILWPLRMENTSIDLDNIDKEDLVEGRNTSGQKLPVKTSYAYEGVGSIKWSAADLVTFMQYQFFKRSGLRGSFQMTQRQYYKKSATESVGLGWNILSRGGDHIYYHHGYLSGYTACIKYAQKKKAWNCGAQQYFGYGSQQRQYRTDHRSFP